MKCFSHGKNCCRLTKRLCVSAVGLFVTHSSDLECDIRLCLVPALAQRIENVVSACWTTRWPTFDRARKWGCQQSTESWWSWSCQFPRALSDSWYRDAHTTCASDPRRNGGTIGCKRSGSSLVPPPGATMRVQAVVSVSLVCVVW